MKRFENKTMVVTGAGSGIGAACVRRLHAEGANVVAVDVNKEQVERVVAELAGGKALAMAASVVDRAQVEAVVATAVERFGNLYGLVNSAGVRGVGNILDYEDAAWERVMSINLDGTFRICQAFARALQKAGTPGSIVNITSAAGLMAVPNRLGYVASKFGVSGITRAMSLELAPFGIRVNAIAPGMIRTPMSEGMFEDPENAKRIRDSHPIGREGRPEEIASVASFMLSDDASFVTGVVMPVDGGTTTGFSSH